VTVDVEQHDGSAPAALPATGQRDDVVDHVAGPAIGIAGLAGFRRAGADEAALFVTRLSKLEAPPEVPAWQTYLAPMQALLPRGMPVLQCFWATAGGARARSGYLCDHAHALQSSIVLSMRA